MQAMIYVKECSTQYYFGKTSNLEAIWMSSIRIKLRPIMMMQLYAILKTNKQKKTGLQSHLRKRLRCSCWPWLSLGGGLRAIVLFLHEKHCQNHVLYLWKRETPKQINITEKIKSKGDYHVKWLSDPRFREGWGTGRQYRNMHCGCHEGRKERRSHTGVFLFLFFVFSFPKEAYDFTGEKA